MTAPAAVLVVDDDASMRSTVAHMLERSGMHLSVRVAETGEEALNLCRTEHIDVMLLDVRLPGKDGLQVLAELKERHSDIGVIMMSVVKETAVVVEAIKLGALDYLTKDFSPPELTARLSKYLAKLKDEKELTWRRRESAASSRKPMVTGSSPAMAEVLALAKKVATAPTTVLITGESGTGKEVLARYLHEQSDRRLGPFIPIDLPALPLEFVESTLFGRDDGGRQTPGRFELAEGGTVLLDEIADLSPQIQARIMRVVQKREIERVGSSRLVPLDIRIICTTCKDLRAAVAKGRFREDLYYRLNVQPITLPPLRQRTEDIAALAGHFLADFSQRYRRPSKSLSDEAVSTLQKLSWRGNVRELENLMERLVINSEASVVEAEDLPGEFQSMAAHTGADRGPTLSEAVAGFEREQIVCTLTKTSGNKREAATLLGIGYSTLRKKLNELGIPDPARDEDQD